MCGRSMHGMSRASNDPTTLVIMYRDVYMSYTMTAESSIQIMGEQHLNIVEYSLSLPHTYEHLVALEYYQE